MKSWHLDQWNTMQPQERKMLGNFLQLICETNKSQSSEWPLKKKFSFLMHKIMKSTSKFIAFGEQTLQEIMFKTKTKERMTSRAISGNR